MTESPDQRYREMAEYEEEQIHEFMREHDVEFREVSIEDDE